MNVNRALRQYMTAIELAGIEQLRRPAAERVAQAVDRLRALVPHDTNLSLDADGNGTEAGCDPPEVGRELPGSGSKQEQLDALCAQVTTCERCPKLVASRTNTVFGVGHPDAKICFFGEGPGADEDRKGEPFVGAAGQLLDKIINACKLKRTDVYILNTVKCRPPGNRNPEAEEIANCRPFYEQQLEIIRPEFIVCLGKVAANTLLETESPVGRLRGRFHNWRFAQVVVTYHPAYLLRNASAKKPVWEDMKMLLHQAGMDY